MKETDVIKTFKENLRSARLAAGYRTAKEFTDAFSEIPYSTYSGYENKGIWPSPDNLVKIADAFNISIDSLLGRNTAASEEEEKIQKAITLLKTNGFFITDLPEQKSIRIGRPVLFRASSTKTGKKVTKEQKEEYLVFYSKLPDFSELVIPYDEVIDVVNKSEAKTKEARWNNDRFEKNKENQRRCFQAFFCAYIAKPRIEELSKILKASPNGEYESEEDKDQALAVSLWSEFVMNMIEIHKVPIPANYDDFE